MKEFMWTSIQVFLPSFAEISKAEVTKLVHDIHHEKCWYFAPFSGTSGANLMKILQDHSSSIPYPSAKFCQNPSSFEEIIVSQ